MAVAVPSRQEGAVVPSPVTAAEAAALRADDVLARLGSRAPGLAEDEAARRRRRVAGPNAVRSHRVHALSVLASQLQSPLLILLAVTALASASPGQASDAPTRPRPQPRPPAPDSGPPRAPPRRFTARTLRPARRSQPAGPTPSKGMV
jgi:hypothetical protein